jgi:hypothetical protein
MWHLPPNSKAKGKDSKQGGQRKRFDCAMTILALHPKAQK